MAVFYKLCRTAAGGHKPGKPGVFRDFPEHCVQPQGKFLNRQTDKIVPIRSNICITQQGLGLQMNKVSWILEMATVRWWPVILLELMWTDPWHMKVINTFTVCCNNLWKSIVYGLEDSGNYFSPTSWSLWAVSDSDGSHIGGGSSFHRVGRVTHTSQCCFVTVQLSHEHARVAGHWLEQGRKTFAAPVIRSRVSY